MGGRSTDSSGKAKRYFAFAYGLLQKLRVMAAGRNLSMSSLAASAIPKTILDEDDSGRRRL
jgi:hypothetical protein